MVTTKSLEGDAPYLFANPVSVSLAVLIVFSLLLLGMMKSSQPKSFVQKGLQQFGFAKKRDSEGDIRPRDSETPASTEMELGTSDCDKLMSDGEPLLTERDQLFQGALKFDVSELTATSLTDINWNDRKFLRVNDKEGL